MNDHKYETFFNIAGWAVVLWGVVATVLLFLYSVHVGSLLGSGFALIAAGTTYVFQALQFHALADDRQPGRFVSSLSFAPVVFWICGALAALSGV